MYTILYMYINVNIMHLAIAVATNQDVDHEGSGNLSADVKAQRMLAQMLKDRNQQRLVFM